MPCPLTARLSLVTLHALIALAPALVVSAPDECGGTQVLLHASARFGPILDGADVRDVPLYALQPQTIPLTLRPSILRNPPLQPLDKSPQRRSFFALFHSLFLPHAHRTSSPHTPFVHAAILHTPPPDREPPNHTPTPTPSPVPLPLALPTSFLSFASIPFVAPTSQRPRQHQTPSHAQPLPHIAPHEAPPPIRAVYDHTSVAEASSESSDIYPLFNACSPLSIPADVQGVKDRVAVVTRGVCDFAQKVSLMQDAGARGVIIVNLAANGDAVVTMKLNDSKTQQPTINIPSVMISFDAWEGIAPCVNDTTVVFSSDGELPFDIDHGREALNWAMMRGMALWILCQCGVNVVRYKRRVSEFRARADAIAALPVDTYTRRSSRSACGSVSPSTEAAEATTPDRVEDIAHRFNSAPDPDEERIGLVAVDDETPSLPPLVAEQARLSGSRLTTPLLTSPSPTISGCIVCEASNSASASASSSTSASSSSSLPLPTSLSTSASASASTSVQFSNSVTSTSVPSAAAVTGAPQQTVETVQASSSGGRYVSIDGSSSTAAAAQEDDDDSDDDDGVCAICLEEFQTGEKSSSNCCPLCKREIPNLPPPPSQLHYGSMAI